MHRPVWKTDGDGRIGNHELHVWMSRRPPDAVPPVPSGWTDAELRRCAALRSEHNQLRCRARRGLMRRVLAKYLRIAPSDVEVVVRPGGKPELSHRGPVNLAFSVSSSHHIVLVAVASGMEVGVDVELVRDLPELAQLASLVLQEVEHREMIQVSPPEVTSWFLQRWTIKEAVLKATGEGLGVDPREVAVIRSHGGETIGRVVPHETRSRDWLLTELNVGDGFVGAVATDRQPAAIDCFQDEW